MEQKWNRKMNKRIFCGGVHKKTNKKHKTFILYPFLLCFCESNKHFGLVPGRPKTRQKLNSIKTGRNNEIKKEKKETELENRGILFQY